MSHRLLFILLLSTLTACGGSGGGGREFRGIIVDQTNRPIPDVYVGVFAEGVGDPTDGSGHYSFVYDKEIPSITLTFVRRDLGINLSYGVPNISPEVDSVLLDFRIDTDRNSVSLTRSEFENDNP